MTPIAPAQLLEALNWRYATKQFDPAKKIPAAIWQTLEEALVLAPSSFGLQPWKFLVIDDPKIRAQLLPLSWNQRQVVDASHLVILLKKDAVDVPHIDAYIQSTAQTRGVAPESLAQYRQMMITSVTQQKTPGELRDWAARQVYIAIGQFMAAAAVLGIDTCPMEGFEPAKYDALLNLEGTGFSSVLVCPAGYRLESDKYAHARKVRFSKPTLIQHL